MANEYVNELEINGQKRLDLTQDTATPETVLEGETFHLRSGAPAVGTYRPSDEIEARLRATVGHSSKNLLEITAETKTINGITFTVDKQAATITVNGTATAEARLEWSPQNIAGGNYYYSASFNQTGSKTTFNSYIYDSTAHRFIKKWDSTTMSPIITSIESQEVQLLEGNNILFSLRIMSGTTVNNLVFKPMLRDGSIADDTFEPYQTPTDEAKIDKPVELVSTATKTFTYPSVSDLKSKYSMLFVTFANSSRSNFAGVWIPTSTIKDNINEQSNYNFASTGFMDRSVPVSIWDDGVHISSTESDETIISIQAFPK